MRKGNTYGVTQAVLERLRTYDGIEINEISVADLELPFCRSCHACFAKGENFCPHFAIVGPVAKHIEECDGLIVSGVCYAMQINAAVKNLIDHFAYLFHRPRLFKTTGMVVTTTAGAGENRVAKYLRQAMGHWGAGKAILLPVKIQTDKFSLSDKQNARIRATADEFYSKIKTGKLSQPSFFSVIVHNSFRAHASHTPPLSECDAAYWRSSGFANKIYPRRIGAIKWLTGKMVHSIMKTVFKNVGDENAALHGE